MTRWVMKRNSTNINELAKATNISETLATVLSLRGLNSPLEVQRFLNASIEDLYDGYLMKDMDKGTEIIIKAINKKQKIVVYGDYDADGIISTYILIEALKKCGANADYYIPDRESEGYGINSKSLLHLKNHGCDVLLTCDNGISAIDEIKYAKQLGMSVVITDHHEVSFVEDDNGDHTSILPQADAIINCKQEDCNYPFKLLCGAGVAFKFIRVLYEKMGFPSERANEFIEYTAIATICDIVDILDENRIITKIGLEMLNKTNNIGLKALIKAVGIQGKEIKSYHIGFIIGPCINATGRLDKADISLELLMCQDADKADIIAAQLKALNEKRQELTEEGFNEVRNTIEKLGYHKEKVILVHDTSIHESVAGIIAGRVKEMYNRPTIVLTNSKDEQFAKGSGRSIEKYNMFEELTKCKDILEKFGGHQMAAGLSVKKDNINILRNMLNSNSLLEERDFLPKLTIDKHIPISEVSNQLIDDIEMLEPYGKGNPAPIFADKDISIEKFYVLGANKNTLKLVLNTQKKGRLNAIGFNKVENFVDILKNEYGLQLTDEIMKRKTCSKNIDIAFVPNLNTYNGVTSLQLRIIDFRISKL